MADLKDLRIESLYSIKGWTCVVTGGGSGIGLMTAKALAANGAKCYITGRRAEKLKDAEMTDSESGGSIVGIQMDVTDKDSIKKTAEEIAEKEKCINLLVNNAGATSVNYGEKGHPTGSPKEVSERMWEYQGFKEWTSIYEVNVASIYFVSVAFVPLLCAARDNGYKEAGSIVNVSSLSGITKGSQNGQYSYNGTDTLPKCRASADQKCAASKAASISLTEQLAVDLKPPGVGIRVNTLAPGRFPLHQLATSYADSTSGYFPSEMTPVDNDLNKPPEHFRERWGTPFGRAGNAKDYAQALLNFAVNGFVSGATLLIDGGYLLAHP